MNKWKILIPLVTITSLVVFALTKDVFYLGMSFAINMLVIFFVSFVMIPMIKRMKKPIKDLKEEIHNTRTPSPHINRGDITEYHLNKNVDEILKKPSYNKRKFSSATEQKIYVPENVRRDIDALIDNIKRVDEEIEDLKRDAKNNKVSHEDYKQTMIYLEGRKEELSKQLKEIEARYK